MKRYKLLGFIFLIILLLACNPSYELKEARIFYGPEDATVIVPITCESIHYNLIGVKKKVVSDQDFLDKMNEYIKSLQADEENNLETKTVDVRIKVLLSYKAKVDTLCMGYSGIILNGELMKDDPGLFKIIRTEVYEDNLEDID